METYRRRLKRQNMALWCGIALLAALDVVLGIFWDDLGLDVFQMTQQARTMQSMLLFGFLIYFIVRLVKNKRRLKDSWAYEEEARRQGDERRTLVGEKAAKLSADLALAGLTVAVFVTSLYNMDMFQALYCALLAFVALRLAAWFYYSRKY